jgi:hypothetical protein
LRLRIPVAIKRALLGIFLGIEIDSMAMVLRLPFWQLSRHMY